MRKRFSKMLFSLSFPRFFFTWNHRRGGTAKGGVPRRRVPQKCVRGRASGKTVRSGHAHLYLNKAFRYVSKPVFESSRHTSDAYHCAPALCVWKLFPRALGCPPSAVPPLRSGFLCLGNGFSKPPGHARDGLSALRARPLANQAAWEKGFENRKFPKVVTRGCKRSFGPGERKWGCTGAKWGCTSAKRPGRNYIHTTPPSPHFRLKGIFQGEGGWGCIF